MSATAIFRAFFLAAAWAAAAAAHAERGPDALVLTPHTWEDGRPLETAAPGVIRLAPGTYPVRREIRLPSGVTLEGAGPGATRLVAEARLASVVANADFEAGGRQVRVRGLAIDCARRAATGVRMVRVSNLILEDLQVRGCRDEGVRVTGRGEVTRDAALRDILVEANAGDGLIVMWAMRGVSYSGVTANRNGGRGIVIDHSEGSATALRADSNTGHGVHVRNVFVVTLDGVTATRNRGHGVFVEGLVASSASNWIAMGNSFGEPGGFDEIHFSGGSGLSYGITRKSRLNGVVVGAYEAGTGAVYARTGVHIDPEIDELRVEGVSEMELLQPDAETAADSSRG